MVAFLSVIAALMMLMTALGIVGLASFYVNVRRKQIGTRRAVGARRIDIIRYFMLENWLLTTGGVVVGTMLAFAFGQWLSSAYSLPRLRADVRRWAASCCCGCSVSSRCSFLPAARRRSRRRSPRERCDVRASICTRHAHDPDHRRQRRGAHGAGRAAFAAGPSRDRGERARRRTARAGARAGRSGDAGHELPQGGDVGRGGRRAVPCDPRALPDAADHAADRLDAPGDGGRTRQGRRRRLSRQAVGRCASADDRAQSARAASPVAGAGARCAQARRVARRARSEVRSVRPGVRKRGDARSRHEGDAHRAVRRARAHHRARTAPARKCSPRSSRRTPPCAAVRSSR